MIDPQMTQMSADAFKEVCGSVLICVICGFQLLGRRSGVHAQKSLSEQYCAWGLALIPTRVHEWNGLVPET
jgi:hypothetical protein